MKRAREMPWIAGVTVGLAVGLGGVALGQLLARKEGQALGQLAQQARQLSDARQRRHDRGLHVQHLFQQARQAGEQLAKAASEQYLPKAKEALSGAFAHAGLNGKLPRSDG